MIDQTVPVQWLQRVAHRNHPSFVDDLTGSYGAVSGRRRSSAFGRLLPVVKDRNPQPIADIYTLGLDKLSPTARC